jgi:hypothetical protein
MAGRHPFTDGMMGAPTTTALTARTAAVASCMPGHWPRPASKQASKQANKQTCFGAGPPSKRAHAEQVADLGHFAHLATLGRPWLLVTRWTELTSGR